MRVQFEKREREILAGLLYIAQSAAIEDSIEISEDKNADKVVKQNKKKMVKDIQKLAEKFRGESVYVLIKKHYLESLGEILTTVMTETRFDEDLAEGELEKMSKEDFGICKNAMRKIEGYLE